MLTSLLHGYLKFYSLSLIYYFSNIYMDTYSIDFQPLLFLTLAFGNKFWIVVLEAS